jgi:hypothetical protein
MPHLVTKLGLLAAGALGLFAVVALAAPRETIPAKPAPPEVVLPEAPLDAATLAELQRQLGHKPFSGTVFEPEKDSGLATGLSPRLLEAAHLLDEAAYVLEQAELFAQAEGLRGQAGELRSQAKAAREGAANGAGPN